MTGLAVFIVLVEGLAITAAIFGRSEGVRMIGVGTACAALGAGLALMFAATVCGGLVS